jgi:chorismate mutase
MTAERTLAAVRNDIDAIDDAIQDLIIRRTALVEQVRRIKRDWPVKIQPSREAEIVYRLLARHHGPFPKRELVAIWRQLIVATLSFEGPFTIAVHAPDENAGCWDVARDHFGLFTPIARHGTVRGVIEAVHRQECTVGVLPLPRPDDHNPWWRHLVTSLAGAPKIIARLPFAGPSNARDAGFEALAICPVTVKPTGRDRSFVCGEGNAALTAGRFGSAMTQAGLAVLATCAWTETEAAPPASLLLAELDGYVAGDDPRLAAARRTLDKDLNRLVWLGAYACPLTVADLGPAAAVPAFPAARPPRSEPAAAP